ncbi:MAG: hypothetical protein ABMB14_32060 [Myxococcota bacterium]
MLAAVGRLDEAVDALAIARRSAGQADLGPIAIEAANLARRRNQPRAALRLLHEAVRAAERPEVAGQAWIRIGVIELDRGRSAIGFAALARARDGLGACRGLRLRATAWAEEGLYRLMLGDLAAARDGLGHAVDDATHVGVGAIERLARFGLALTHRLQGDDDDAEAERIAADARAVPRWDEPGVYALRALERRAAGALPEAWATLDAGLARDRDRPNPADAALLEAVALGWTGAPFTGARGAAASGLGLARHTPPYARALVHAARGEATGRSLARRIGQQLVPALVRLFGPAGDRP